ncbi:Oligogalacturonate lyase [Cronobacter universalis NCTC 9529]|nr:Oligogalacturonate lyase [Cronobacter universalis NCTC 9529]
MCLMSHKSWETFAGSRQVTHPHPSFSPDGNAILFSTDKDGKPAVYLAKLPEQREMLRVS